MRVQTPQMYTLTYKRCDYIHTQTHVCIYKYLCVGICTIHMYGHSEYWCCVSLICKPKAVSNESEIRHFYFSILTSTCLVTVAARNVDRTAKLPSLFLINILHDRQKLTKEPSWRENKNHWQMRASCQMLCLLDGFLWCRRKTHESLIW